VGSGEPSHYRARLIGIYRGDVVLTRAFLDIVFVWLASTAFIQPGLVQLVPLLLTLTVTSTLAFVSLTTTLVFARVPDSLRLQWLRSIGVPATGLSGSVPSGRCH
jgi:Mg/Co/Ni transporter MgtE